MTKQLISVFTGEIAGQPVQLCDARDLAIQRRFPRSETLQHCGIRFPSFCSENRKICR